MSISYMETGRKSQKARTCDALIAAARRLLEQGDIPTVEEAAAAASISRATAYRYFSNQGALLVACHPEMEQTSLLGPSPPTDVFARLDRLVDEIAKLTLEFEPSLRASLHSLLEPDAEHRDEIVEKKQHRHVWVEDALAPVRPQLSEAEWRKLTLGIAAGIGVEKLVWLTDVIGLSREEAFEVIRWSARAILRSTLDAR